MRTLPEREQRRSDPFAAATDALTTTHTKNQPADGLNDAAGSRPAVPGEPPLLPEAGLRGLRRQFVIRTREDYALLKGHQERGTLEAPEMVAIVHRLAGTAGMLGYAEISVIAGRLDDELAEGSDNASKTLRDLFVVLEEATSPNGAA